MVEEKVETKGFQLPGGKVRIMPLKRKRGRNNEIDESHENNFLFGTSSIQIVPKIHKNGSLRSPLTTEETKFFENSALSHLPFEPGELSIHKKTDNFWRNSKNSRIKLTETPMTLDLSDAMDYIKYKILLSNDDKIAPSPEEKDNKLTYKFVIVPEGYEDKARSKKFDRNKAIWKYIAKIEDDKEEIVNFLSIMYPKKSLSLETSMTDLQSMLEESAENNKDLFLDTMKDKDLTIKAIIKRALKRKALVKEGIKYSLPEGDEIGNNLNDTIAFLKNPKNQEILDKIEARIKQ